MIIIKFSTQKAEVQTTASIKNNVLKYNKDSVDLTTIPNGATAKSEYVTIDKDVDGNITITMLWQYVESAKKNCFPKDLEIEEGEIYPMESTNEV